MDKRRLNSAIQSLLEREIPPASIDLWPQVEAELVARKQLHSKQGAISMNRSFNFTRRARLMMALGLAVVCIFTFLAATPQGNALAQSILSYFFRSEGNVEAVPTLEAGLLPQPESIAATPPAGEGRVEELEGCGSLLAPRCSIEEVQPLVGFALRIPSELPEGIAFTAATQYRSGVLLRFEGQSGVLLLAETPLADDDLQTWTIGQDAVIETVTVGNRPAEYVQGSWRGLDFAEEGGMAWDPDMPTHTLRWEEDSVRYTLVHFPQRTASGPAGLDFSQLEKIGAGLVGPGEPVEGFAGAAKLTLQEAAAQAGFEVSEPSWLPAGYVLDKAAYSSQSNAVCLYYRYHADEFSPAMVIAQSKWALPPVDAILAQAYYDGKAVEMARFEQPLMIRGAAGEQGWFVETGLRADRYCGGEEAPANRALLWQNGERTFLLFAQLDAFDGRGFVSVQEMRRLAESLNGIEPDPSQEAGLDAERLLSVNDAEALTGIDLKLPALMLSNVRFDHIAYKAGRGDEKGYTGAFYAGPPVGDGRAYHVLVMQLPESENTLENLALAGGYEPVAVRGNPAIYRAMCWDSSSLAAGSECRQDLIWLEEDTEYGVYTYFPALAPEETLLAIAESMR